MKLDSLIKYSIFLFISSCQPIEQCKDNICLTTSIEEQNNEQVVKLYFISKVDTTLTLDDKIFSIGCPDYIEVTSLFIKEKPSLNDLKYSQILLENTKGEFRVFSSEFFKEGELKPIILPNCAFLSEFQLLIGKEMITSYEFFILKRDDLKVRSADKKVKLHLYLKNEDGGIIISSSNWIYL